MDSLWGLRTSLYSTLTATETEVLEEALCAGCGGSLALALNIFETRLPSAESVPILAIEKANLLASMGREIDCAALCRAALEQIENFQSPAVFYCISLREGLSELYIGGRLMRALERARAFEIWFKDTVLEQYSDIHVYCIRLYYQIILTCRDTSNYVEDGSEYALPGTLNFASAHEKIKTIREHLISAGRIAESVQLLRIEMLIRGKPRRPEPFAEWIRAAEISPQSSAPSMQVRIAKAKLEYAEELIDLGKQTLAAAQIDEVSIQMASLNSDMTWESEFPQIHLNYCILRARVSSQPPSVTQYLAYGARAARINDLRLQRLCQLNANKVASEELTETPSEGKRESTHRVRMNLIHDRIDFESNTTGEAYFLSVAIYVLGVATVTKGRTKPAEFLNIVKEFQQRYPDFDVPNFLLRIVSVAQDAARQVGDIQSETEYHNLGDSILQFCSHTKKLYDGYPIYLDEASFHHNWDPKGRLDYWRQYERSAAGLVCAWAKEDLNSNLISAKEYRSLTGMGGEDSPGYLHLQCPLQEVARNLCEAKFGNPKPASQVQWYLWLQNIEPWLRRKDLCHASLRLELLVKIQIARRDHLTNLLANTDLHMMRYVIPEVIESRKKVVDILIQVRSSSPGLVTMDTVIDAKLLAANAIQVLSDLPRAREDGLISDEMIQQNYAILQECLDHYKKHNRLENAARTLHWLGQCCWSRHFLFNIIPITDAFPFTEEADVIYRQLRMENIVLQGSRSYVARYALSETLQLGIMTSLAVRYSFRAFVQRTANQASYMPVEFTAVRLQNILVSWIQRSKAQALSDMLGLDSNPPASIISGAQKQKVAFSIVEQEIGLIKQLANAPISRQIQIRADIHALRDQMRKEPDLLPLLNIREGISANAKEVQEMSAEFGPHVVLVDWAYLLFLDAWDLFLVTYRNGKVDRIAGLPLKLDYVRKWTDDQLRFQDPLNQRNADYFLHKLDPLVAPLAHITAPGELLIFCPTKVLHRVPLHALRIGHQIAIERNPIVYCQSLSVLRLCYISTKREQESESHQFQASVFSPLPPSPELLSGLESVASTLCTTITPRSDSPKATFLNTLKTSNLVHFHGHSELNIANPLRQHLDFSGFSLPEDQKHPSDMLTADEIFDVSLHRPSHVTIMGCSSARATVSDCDDLFGLTTALYCAGASSVISALWPIGSNNGILFSEAFYSHLMGQVDNSSGPKIVNMAKAMQVGVLALMKDGERNRKPYHWAGLVLSGYWLFRIK